MQRALRPSALVPRGFDVESASCDGATTVIIVRPMSGTSPCPGCRARSKRIHSRYQRRLADLPLAGRQVRLVVVARRFRCDTVLCDRRIFTERFDDGALTPWARRTTRLDFVVHHLGLALGGRPAASFARRLMMPVSNDTLLRVVRRRGCPPSTLLSFRNGLHGDANAEGAASAAAHRWKGPPYLSQNGMLTQGRTSHDTQKRWCLDVVT